jgi:alpha-N-acetylglucosamine transferase
MYAACSRSLLVVVHRCRQPISSTNVLVAYTFSPMSAAPRNITTNLRNLEDALPGWRVAPLNSTDGSQHSWTSKVRSFVNSRVFWRTLLSMLLLLLLIDLFRAQSVTSQFMHPDAHQTTHEAPPAHVTNEPDWSQYAYCQYVTNEDYLCNSLMIFESLDRVGAKASKVMMYPQGWDVSGSDHTSELLRKARDSYGVQLSPIEVQHLKGEETWADSFTKLLVFNQTQYKRVLSLDSDATVLQSMDELFLLPPSAVAMPRAYWLDDTLSSQMVLVEPSDFEFRRVLDAFSRRQDDDFDMEIVNELYGKDCTIIPHRRYDLITGEFNEKEHHRYLGSKEEIWDPQKALEEAKFVHFSDWPLPKPWLPHTEEAYQKKLPVCHEVENGQDCRDRDVWTGLYQDFTERREVRDSVPLLLWWHIN